VLPDLESHSENVLEYVLTFVGNTYAIFNPLTGGTLHLTIAMYLPQWAQKPTHLDSFLPLLTYKNPEHFCVQLMSIVSDSRMNTIEEEVLM
jgi:hypothetical protein